MKLVRIAVPMWLGAVVLTSFAVSSAWAQSGRSLDKCQGMLQREGAKYAAAIQRGVGACLQKVSGELVRKDQAVPDVARAANACVAQFYRIGRTDGYSLSGRAQAKILRACDPANADHSADDVLGSGAPSVNQSLQAELRLDGFCAEFGGGVGSVSEWIDCMLTAAECQGRQQAAVGFPRAVEWLELVEAELAQRTDIRGVQAHAALQDTLAAIDGTPAGDGLANLSCGANDLIGTCASSLAQAQSDLATCSTDLTDAQSDLADAQSALGTCTDDLDDCSGDLATCTADLTTCAADLATAAACGNGVVDSGEDCDYGDLDGATCVSEGFAGGTLACGAGCAFDTSGCWAQRFVDNGDGTITDHDTGLVWEKKIQLDEDPDPANPHDADNEYAWAGNCTLETDKLCQPTAAAAALCAANSENGTAGCALCVGDDGTCDATETAWTHAAELNDASFGGFTDWRVPRRAELVSIVDYAKPSFSPVVAPAFHGAACGTACDDLSDPACSCTRSLFYWSASTITPAPAYAWLVYFNLGIVGTDAKATPRSVRAVRGG